MMVLSERKNSGSIFLLLGFSDNPELKIPISLVFLSIYSITVVDNIGMILIIRINPKLHIPMYYFLSHLSFVDFSYSSIIAPKMLVNFVAKDKIISFIGCIVQYFWFSIFVATEVVMAYDWFVDICNPLLHTVVMSQKLCVTLVIGSYARDFTCSLTLMCSMVQLSFYGVNRIDHFCEFSSLLALLPLILTSANYCCSLFLHVMLSAHFSSSFCLTCLLLLLSSRCLQPVGIVKLSPPVHPIWQPSPPSMVPFYFFFVCPTLRTPGSQSKWALCFIQWLFACWTPWSTVLEIKMSKTQSPK